MSTKIITLIVGLLFTTGLAQAEAPQYASGEVPTQKERQQNQSYHRIGTDWQIVSEGHIVNQELYEAMDLKVLEAQSIDFTGFHTVNPRDFHVVDDVAAGVFPRMQLQEDGATVFVPFVMSIQIAKSNKLLEPEQGTINISGELVFTTTEFHDEISNVEVRVYDFSQRLERMSHQSQSSPLAKYDGTFVEAMTQVIATGFYQADEIEDLRNLLIALQIGDRPETVIANDPL